MRITTMCEELINENIVREIFNKQVRQNVKVKTRTFLEGHEMFLEVICLPQAIYVIDNIHTSPSEDVNLEDEEFIFEVLKPIIMKIVKATYLPRDMNDSFFFNEMTNQIYDKVYEMLYDQFIAYKGRTST